MSVMCEGASIKSVSAAGTSSGTATLIEMPHQSNIFIVTLGASARGLKFPPDADTDIGDVAEFHFLPGGDPALYDNGGAPISVGVSLGDGHTLVMRKIAADTWRSVSYAAA